MRNFDFPAKARWRKWQERQIKATNLRITPPFRRALLLDPQLLETEMQLAAIKAHMTMGTYPAEEETFVYAGIRFVGSNGVADLVMSLIRRQGSPEKIPASVLEDKKIRME